ncbi:DUF421 domain-containing protein [Aquibacillus halophilus]|uniref:DUF421 domain-containing protein n=1 Tax=Aquibacillus halophilus TaxID=930132 RepID=A0A6A8DHE9_9BACI|nr:DUF421 domain-containing protein [Aquibacillus halophilus]MRH45104.1 DUF421 domain-containing protein [Aquibacillus halophilus]
MELGELVLRIALAFTVLLIMTRIMGRKELAQMTFFNFVSAIAIGSIAANLAVNSNLSITNGVWALIGWSALTVVMGFIHIKSKAASVLVQGQPLILIKDGQIMDDVMGKARVSLDSLNAMLREQKVFSVSDVQYAVFETNGKLSLMMKDNKQNATRSDVGVQKTANDLFAIPTAVVSDGTVNKKNLTNLNLDEDWLNQQLSQAGITDISNVFYAEVQKDGSLYIDNKNDVIH